MRIAQPLLDTKLGRGVVELSYLGLDVAESVIDAGSKKFNWISTNATKFFNWIADTSFGKNVKDAAMRVASSSVIKSAVSMAVYVFTKMSNFCTAVVESYRYYNQCRTIARRIVNEKVHLVDEHTLIKTFQGVRMQEAKKIEQNQDTDDVSFDQFTTKTK